MLIRRVSAGIYDIFGDKGFDQWTRVKKFHYGIKVVAGALLPRIVVREVVDAIESNPAGSLENINAA